MKRFKNILGLLAVCFYLFAFVDSTHSVVSEYLSTVNGKESHSSSQEIENSETPYRWFEISHSHTGSFLNHQEYSGNGMASPQFLVPVVLFTRVEPPLVSYFKESDQRKLIFQYLYPFHFFF